MASMRPRPDAAENLMGIAQHGQRRVASMRPRPDAAENSGELTAGISPSSGFNEAAARCRGKRGRRRPVVAGEGSFNEAAARCRGKPRPASRRPACCPGFNEAAARCRGKPGRRRPVPGAAGASMRPRPDAAENARHPGAAVPRPAHASMRPRPDAAENGQGAGSDGFVGFELQ